MLDEFVQGRETGGTPPGASAWNGIARNGTAQNRSAWSRIAGVVSVGASEWELVMMVMFF
jgi:hypothetical protein